VSIDISPLSRLSTIVMKNNEGFGVPPQDKKKETLGAAARRVKENVAEFLRPSTPIGCSHL